MKNWKGDFTVTGINVELMNSKEVGLICQPFFGYYKMLTGMIVFSSPCGILCIVIYFINNKYDIKSVVV